MIAVPVFLGLLLLMFLNVPIAIATGLATLIGIYLVEGFPIAVLVQRMYVGIDSFTLLAIPLFILTGRLMALGGITSDLIKLSKSLIGFARGGLAYVNIVASMFFAGITGSATADTASIGAILIPAMIGRGYEKDFSVAVTATSSTIGIMIPPSIPMVIYGVSAGVSVGKLFLGGIIPGILTGITLMTVSYILAVKRNYPAEERMPFKETIKVILRGIPPLLTVVIIIGGIISGIFTATEAAGIAALYSFLLGTLYYRELKIKDIPQMMIEVSVITGMVTLMIGTASALGWLFSSQNVPYLIGNFLLSITDNVYLILLLFNILLLFVGTWLDLSPAVIIFTPILLPIVTNLGINPIHFGVIMVVNLGIGLFTPPVGVCLFVSCGIAGISISDVIKAFIPFFLSMLFILLLITYIPQLVMFLPNLIMT
jgi:tripartite ATP-independent transporter DctM subunit